MHNGLTDIPGLKVGHWTDLEAATRCTVVLCLQGAVAGVDVRGTGATAGKMLGFGRATKTGLGTAAKKVAGGIVVAALVAVNAFGDVRDPDSRQIIAGACKVGGRGFVDSVKFAESRIGQVAARMIGANTTLAVVATNVALTKSKATKVAQMAHDGLARTIRPVHTHFDGDTIFALSAGAKKADLSLIGTLAADVLAAAVIAAVMSAESLAGLPAARDLLG